MAVQRVRHCAPGRPACSSSGGGNGRKHKPCCCLMQVGNAGRSTPGKTPALASALVTHFFWEFYGTGFQKQVQLLCACLQGQLGRKGCYHAPCAELQHAAALPGASIRELALYSADPGIQAAHMCKVPGCNAAAGHCSSLPWLAGDDKRRLTANPVESVCRKPQTRSCFPCSAACTRKSSTLLVGTDSIDCSRQRAKRCRCYAGGGGQKGPRSNGSRSGGGPAAGCSTGGCVFGVARGRLHALPPPQCVAQGQTFAFIHMVSQAEEAPGMSWSSPMWTFFSVHG